MLVELFRGKRLAQTILIVKDEDRFFLYRQDILDGKEFNTIFLDVVNLDDAIATINEQLKIARSIDEDAFLRALEIE